jgi:hypothetical protein
MDVSYLILDAQLNLLRRNLEEVERVVDAFEEGQRGLQELLESPPQQARDTLKDALVSVGQLRDAYEDDDDDEAVLGLIDDIEAMLRKVRTELRSSMKEAGKLARRSPARMGDFRDTLKGELVDKLTKTKIDKLTVLQQDLNDAIALEATAPEEALATTQAAWQTFATEVIPGTSEVFGEYVEFLGGLALRYTGFDRGMCVIADELMSSTGRLPGFIWRSLTLPSRDERLSLTHMIGLGFPEWTIWSLPLSVHAIGEAWMQTDAVRRWADEQTTEPQARHVLTACVADAVATHVLGPAYGCALILLRLNPFNAFAEGTRLDPMRARAVLETLAKLNEQEADPGFADEVIEALRGSWHAALRQAGQGESLDENEDGDGLTDAEVETVQACVDYVAKTLGSAPAFQGERWIKPIIDLSDALASGTADEVELDVSEDEPTDLLRDVLNAAWHCRLLGEPTDLALIDEDAKDLWRRLEEEMSRERRTANGRRQRGRTSSER